MKKVEYVLLCILLMALIIPMHETLAVSKQTPAYTHFVYMFGHANVIHWLINSVSLVLLTNLISLPRMVTAYVSAVAVSFLLYDDMAVIGASVFVCWLVGFMSLWLWNKRRMAFWQMAAATVIMFFIPGIAAMHHLAMMAAGLIGNRVEYLIADFKRT